MSLAGMVSSLHEVYSLCLFLRFLRKSPRGASSFSFSTTLQLGIPVKKTERLCRFSGLIAGIYLIASVCGYETSRYEPYCLRSPPEQSLPVRGEQAGQHRGPPVPYHP